MNAELNLCRTFGLVAALCLFAPLTAFSEENNPASPAPAPAAGQGELARFEAFLDQHPVIEARLRENPDIVNNPAFQKNHPQIAQFLARHPEISAELAASPRWFIHREIARQSASPVTHGQIVEFDRFLDLHPRLEKLLVQHPQLLRHPDFLKNYPELHEYLKQHPGLDRATESKQGRMTKREFMQKLKNGE